MFHFGFLEILLILVVALFVLGPTRLPEVAHGLGKLFAKIKSIKNNFDEQINEFEKQETLKQNIQKAKEAEKTDPN